MSALLNESIEKLHGLFDSTDIEVEWKKIQKKIEEARYNTGDVNSLADCIYSLLLAARSRGYGPDAVLQALDKVAEKNLHRRWKRMEDGTYQAT